MKKLLSIAALSAIVMPTMAANSRQLLDESNALVPGTAAKSSAYSRPSQSTEELIAKLQAYVSYGELYNAYVKGVPLKVEEFPSKVTVIASSIHCVPYLDGTAMTIDKKPILVTFETRNRVPYAWLRMAYTDDQGKIVKVATGEMKTRKDKDGYYFSFGKILMQLKRDSVKGSVVGFVKVLDNSSMHIFEISSK